MGLRSPLDLLALQTCPKAQDVQGQQLQLLLHCLSGRGVFQLTLTLQLSLHQLAIIQSQLIAPFRQHHLLAFLSLQHDPGLLGVGSVDFGDSGPHLCVLGELLSLVAFPPEGVGDSVGFGWGGALHDDDVL